MDKAFNGLDRIDLFAQEIITQISLGHKETITKIVEEMDRKHVVRYLYEKYKGVAPTDSLINMPPWIYCILFDTDEIELLYCRTDQD